MEYTSNKKLATVSNGKFKGIKDSTVIITAKSKDDNKTVTCKITVKNNCNTDFVTDITDSLKGMISAMFDNQATAKKSSTTKDFVAAVLERPS